MKVFDLVVLVLVIVGAINWGLVGAFNVDLVAVLFGTMPVVAKIVYILVGVAGLYMLYTKLVKKT